MDALYQVAAAPGSPVYVIHAGDRAVLVGEQDLTGSLRDLVITILAAGGPHSVAPAQGSMWPGVHPRCLVACVGRPAATCRSRDDLLAELADVIITAAIAMSGFTEDVDEARSQLEWRLAAVTGWLSHSHLGLRPDGAGIGRPLKALHHGRRSWPPLRGRAARRSQV